MTTSDAMNLVVVIFKLQYNTIIFCRQSLLETYFVGVEKTNVTITASPKKLLMGDPN